MAAETVNVVLAVANITADPAPAVSMVSYFCDTTGGDFFVTVPDVAGVTDGIQIRVTLSAGVGGVAVTTVGGTDLIGTSISQKIVLAGTGITIQANAGAGKWEIIQDSRNVWGDITGTLANQSDLQAALDAKAAKAISIRTYTGTTDTLVLGDAGNMVRGNNAGANTCTIPLNAVVAFPIGTQILFVQRGAGQMSIAITGGGTLNSYGVALKLVGQYAQALATKVDTDEWSIDGNLTT